MTVRKVTLDGCEVAVVEVHPSDNPPIRFEGRTWIRVGPRRAMASAEEERRLLEKRQWANLTFDARGLRGASRADLDLERFRMEYLHPEALRENHRPEELQLQALRLLLPDGTATPTAILVLGVEPRRWLPGAYIQFLRVNGPDLTDPMIDHHEITGTVADQIRQIDELVRLHIVQGARPEALGCQWKSAPRVSGRRRTRRGHRSASPMKTVALFNNKGGVGKTALAYHLGYMFGELGHPVVFADLDPQANLSSMCLDDDRIEDLWGRKQTIYGAIERVKRGIGDIVSIQDVEVTGRIHVIPGDLRLSEFEEDLSQVWPKCLDRDERAFLVTTSSYRALVAGAEHSRAGLAILDVGPNFGAVNRAALLAADYVLVPVAPDLFSMQGLENVGPRLKEWRRQWKERKEKAQKLDFELPGGKMTPLGYVISRHSVLAGGAVKAYQRWIDRMPAAYRTSGVRRFSQSCSRDFEQDGHRRKSRHAILEAALRRRIPTKGATTMGIPGAGRFCWHELMTTDLDAATKFYTELLGWSFRDNPGPSGVYRMFSLGDAMVAGAMTTPPGLPSFWLVYVAVDDADAATKSITELGGKVMVPATTVPDMLRFACASDPQGAAFGVLQPFGPPAQQPPYEGPDRPGTFCWDELHTRDTAGAKTFYSRLFGWTGKGEADGGDAYWHWKNRDKEIGGMTSHGGGAQVPPHWLSYVAVSDVDAVTGKVASLGGKVLVPAMEIPNVGRFSVVQDPTGAVVSPFRSARV